MKNILHYLIFITFISFYQNDIIAQEDNGKICMYNGVLSNYKVIQEEEYDITENDTNGTIITRTSHNLGLEKILLRDFDLKVNIEWIDDSGGFNAFATSEVTDSTKIDGTILLGKNLFNAIEYPGSRYVILHEVAHIVDFKHDLKLFGKDRELFADFVAGFILGYDNCSALINDISGVAFGFITLEKALEQKQERRRQAINVLIDFLGAGDIDFNSSSGHGTSEERMQAVNKGYNLGYFELRNAYDLLGELVDDEISKSRIKSRLNKTFKNYRFEIIGYKTFEAKPIIVNLFNEYKKK